MAGRADLVARLLLDRRGFNTGLADAKAEVAAWSKNIAAGMAGAFTLGAVVSYANNVKDEALKVKDLSEQLALTTDQVQRFSNAASRIGLGDSDWQKAYMAVDEFREKVRGGNAEAIAFANTWNLSIADIENANIGNIQIVEQLSEAIKGIDLSDRQRAGFRNIFGAKGPKFTEALNEYRNNVDADLIIPAGAIEQIDVAGKAIERLLKLGKAVTAEIGAGFISFFRGFTLGKPMSGIVEQTLRKQKDAIIKEFKDVSAKDLTQWKTDIESIIESGTGSEADQKRLDRINIELERRKPAIEQAQRDDEREKINKGLEGQKELAKETLELRRKENELAYELATNGDVELQLAYKKNELQQKLNNLLVAQSEYDDGTAAGAIEVAKIKKDTIDTQLELIDVERKAEEERDKKARENSVFFRPQEDELLKSGNFLGASAATLSRSINPAQGTEDRLDGVNERLDSLIQTVQRNNRGGVTFPT